MQPSMAAHACQETQVGLLQGLAHHVGPLRVEACRDFGPVVLPVPVSCTHGSLHLSSCVQLSWRLLWDCIVQGLCCFCSHRLCDCCCSLAEQRVLLPDPSGLQWQQSGCAAAPDAALQAVQGG